jgi:hypothetical protein
MRAAAFDERGNSCGQCHPAVSTLQWTTSAFCRSGLATVERCSLVSQSTNNEQTMRRPTSFRSAMEREERGDNP